MHPIPNVVLFGESGCGKSSMINMISGESLAVTSSGARGCTFRSTAYMITVFDKPFKIYDTAGLNEGESDNATVPANDAVEQLFRLLKSLHTGVNLLIFCMRGPRVKNIAYKNWRLFYEVICQRKVPIVLAITGLEDENNMDEWYVDNKGAFQQLGMFPHGVACITAIRGKALKNGGYRYDEEYMESQEKLWNLMRKNCLEIPWKVEPVQWFATIVEVSYTSGPCPWNSVIEHQVKREVIGPGIEHLIECCEMTPEEAEELGSLLAYA